MTLSNQRRLLQLPNRTASAHRSVEGPRCTERSSMHARLPANPHQSGTRPRPAGTRGPRPHRSPRSAPAARPGPGTPFGQGTVRPGRCVPCTGRSGLARRLLAVARGPQDGPRRQGRHDRGQQLEHPAATARRSPPSDVGLRPFRSPVEGETNQGQGRPGSPPPTTGTHAAAGPEQAATPRSGARGAPRRPRPPGRAAGRRGGRGAGRPPPHDLRRTAAVPPQFTRSRARGPRASPPRPPWGGTPPLLPPAKVLSLRRGGSIPPAPPLT